MIENQFSQKAFLIYNRNRKEIQLFRGFSYSMKVYTAMPNGIMGSGTCSSPLLDRSSWYFNAVAGEFMSARTKRKQHKFNRFTYSVKDFY